MLSELASHLMRDLRKRMTVDELSDTLGIARSTVYNIMEGHKVDVEVLERILELSDLELAVRRRHEG